MMRGSQCHDNSRVGRKTVDSTAKKGFFGNERVASRWISRAEKDSSKEGSKLFPLEEFCWFVLGKTTFVVVVPPRCWNNDGVVGGAFFLVFCVRWWWNDVGRVKRFDCSRHFT